MRPYTRRRARQAGADFDTGESSIVDRLRQGLAEAGLDCRCNERAERIFDQVEEMGRAGALEEARRMRDAIAIIMVLLTELDELNVNDADPSAFGEIADLFEDLGDHAIRGAVFARLLVTGRGNPEGGLQ
ncbi:hypothetical protein [Oricola sp.]|uniref:hypothetical protein n=1 Tax=Oricola sp. TaxID=1979950 RepID=UPI003519A70E